MPYNGTGAIIGAGSILAFSDTLNGTYTPLDELVKIQFPDDKVERLKATNMESTGKTHEYIPGFGDPNEINIDGNYLKTTINTLRGIKKLPKFWKLTLPDSSIFGFPGFVTAVEGEADATQRMPMKATIAVSGAINFTPGS